MMMMTTMNCLFVKISLLATLLSLATAASSPQQQGYNLLRRQAQGNNDASTFRKARPRSLQDDGTSQVISFDGDLDRIVQLALERAGETFSPGAMPSLAPAVVPTEMEDAASTTAPSTTSSSSSSPPLTPTSSPSLSSAPSISPAPSLPPVMEVNTCPGAILNRLVLVGWSYTIETAPTADPSQVIGEVEEILQESLIPIVLTCNNEMAMDGSIVAVDSTLPRDSISVDAVCAPELSTSNDCTVVDGVIRIFLSDPGQNEVAEEMMKQAIEAVVNGPDFVNQVGTGLVKINILQDDDTTSPAENEKNPRVPDPELDDSLKPGNESGFGTVSVVILAVGGAALIAFVGTFYYWRHGNDGDGNATQMAGQSTMVDSETQPPPSPFSEMLPRAYKFNDSMSILTGQGDHMSPITERNEDSRSSSGTPSVIMSEFSTDPDTTANSFDMGSSSISGSGVHNMSMLVGQSPNLLGARKRASGNNDDDDDPARALDLNDSLSAIDSQLSIETPLVANTSAYQNKTLLADNADLKSVQEEEEAQDNSLLFLSQLDAPQAVPPSAVTDSEDSAVMTATMMTGTVSALSQEEDATAAATAVHSGSGETIEHGSSGEEPALVDASDKGAELV